jgi:hypothetical protein
LLLIRAALRRRRLIGTSEGWKKKYDAERSKLLEQTAFIKLLMFSCGFYILCTAH